MVKSEKCEAIQSKRIASINNPDCDGKSGIVHEPHERTRKKAGAELGSANGFASVIADCPPRGEYFAALRGSEFKVCKFVGLKVWLHDPGSTPHASPWRPSLLQAGLKR